MDDKKRKMALNKMITYDEETGNFYCDMCGRCKKRRQDLVEHIEMEHAGDLNVAINN